MEQNTTQNGAQAAEQRRPPHRFQPGQSGNPAGRISRAKWQAMVDAQVAELAAAFGGVSAMDAVDMTLLVQAANLLLRRPRRGEDDVRRINATERLLSRVARRHGIVDGKREPQPRDLSLAEVTRRKDRMTA